MIYCLSRCHNENKKEKIKNGRSYLIEKQYYIIIHPNTFDFGKIINKQLIERVIAFTTDETLLLDDNFNRGSYLPVKDLLNQHCELVKYDGFPLDHLFWKFWNRDYAKIVEFMKKITLQIGVLQNWFNENVEPLYI